MRYQLNFWQSKTGEISRIYVNSTETRDSVGFFEKRTREIQRSGASYYDRHRIAKGDTTHCEINYSSTVPAEVAAKIGAAVNSVEGYETLADPLYFETLQTFARGVNWCCSKARKAQLKKLADAFVVEV
jgi:hypothetical protein